jgi:hypothetical protein
MSLTTRAPAPFAAADWLVRGIRMITSLSLISL